ncbi:hypothetical protein HKX48_005102 [Thoreauomyces humboldtii]|nr:hypothetical protein HKX48_005102 [Thoreauomyces humboldtii]
MAQELAQYQFQLDQVDEALLKTPDNEELTKLREDLTQLITLYSSLVQQEQAATASVPAPGQGSKKKKVERKFEIGQTVSAKYAANGKFYEGVIEALPEGTPDGTYSIIFKGYTTKESVERGDVRELAPAAPAPVAASTAVFDPPTVGVDKRRQAAVGAPVTAATIAASDPSATKKKKKHKPKDAGPTKREKEQVEKQNAWLSFAKGGDKKRKASSSSSKLPAMKKPSMFATPDDPTAKVGVIKKSMTMTQFHERGKHIFQHDA